MSRINISACVALMTATLASMPASATNCLKDHDPYQLTGDSIEWSMTIAPGTDCIQGLRWSYMQIYAVWVLEKPANGELVTVGSGFRYFAKPGFSGTDKFSLVVIGKNRREEGYSTVEITVTPRNIPPASSSIADSQPGPELPAKVANAALSR
jgi:hypothetical protein